MITGEEVELSGLYPSDTELHSISKLDGRDFLHDCEVILNLWPSDSYSNLYKKESFDDYTEYALYLHTKGTLGLESIISTLQKNHLWWSLYWEESKRGGYYKFLGEVSNAANS